LNGTVNNYDKNTLVKITIYTVNLYYDGLILFTVKSITYTETDTL